MNGNGWLDDTAIIFEYDVNTNIILQYLYVVSFGIWYVYPFYFVSIVIDWNSVGALSWANGKFYKWKNSVGHYL